MFGLFIFLYNIESFGHVLPVGLWGQQFATISKGKRKVGNIPTCKSFGLGMVNGEIDSR